MLECELVTSGVYCGRTLPDESEEQMPEYRRRARNWRLLFQVPTVEEIGMEWGDVGCLYFWIREEDLRQRRFDRCWMILQSA